MSSQLLYVLSWTRSKRSLERGTSREVWTKIGDRLCQEPIKFDGLLPLLFSQPRYSTPTLPFLWRLFIQIKRWKGLETLLSLLAILPRLLYAAPPPPPPLPPLPTLKRLLRRTCRKCGNLSLGSILRNSKKKFCKAWRNFETSVSHGFQSHLTFDEMGSHF